MGLGADWHADTLQKGRSPVNPVVLQGIFFGLMAATLQSLCYVFSRIFVTKPGNTSGLLFALSHTQMGIAAVVAAPILLTAGLPDSTRFFWPLMGAAFFYLAGQVALFRALRSTEASRVSPLLGLKILILAVITSLALGGTVSELQWVAVGLSVLAAFTLNYSGGSIPLPAVGAVLFCCVGYSLSDLSIRALVLSLDSVGPFRAVLLACAMSYVVTGVVGAGLLPTCGRATRAQWKAALPVSVTWLMAMVCLFATFRLVGVVFGNIVQSTRGVLSILMGVLIARLGHLHLESTVPASVFWRRVAAAAMMTAAVAMYVLGLPE